MHTHCLPGARVLDVSVQIPAILKDDESVAAVVIHAGANDTKLRQTETLKRGLQEPDRDGTQHNRQRRRSSCQDLFPRIDEDTNGSVDCLL